MLKGCPEDVGCWTNVEATVTPTETKSGELIGEFAHQIATWQRELLEPAESDQIKLIS